MFSHVSVFVLPVGLSVIASDPISKGGGCTSCVTASNFSMEIVIETLEETLSQVHVANRVNFIFEDNAARELAIPEAPVMFNPF